MFRVTWTPGHATAAGADRRQSKLVLPKREFPDGYGAVVEGGAVVSNAGAEVLRVVACAGATSVRVTVSATDRTSRATCAVAKRCYGTARRVRLTVGSVRR